MRIVSPGHENATSTSRISHSCDPSTNTMKISSGSSGTLLTMSAVRWMTRSTRPPMKPLMSPRPVPMAVLTTAAERPMSSATGSPNSSPSIRSRPCVSVPASPYTAPPATVPTRAIVSVGSATAMRTSIR